MTGGFTEQHIPEALRILDRGQTVWAGISVLLLAVSFILSESVPPVYLTPGVMVMAVAISEDIHRAFPMGNMRMVLILSHDIGGATGGYVKGCLWRLMPFTALAALMMLLGMILRVGIEGVGFQDVFLLAYMAIVSDTIVLVRWVFAVRLGRRMALRIMAGAVLFALLPLAPLSMSDWTACACLCVAVPIVMMMAAEGLRALRGPSKERMLGGI